MHARRHKCHLLRHMCPSILHIRKEYIIMKQLNEAQFNELISGSKPVVCDFFATWCGPCKMLAPVLEKVSADYADKAEFVKVDVDEAAALSVKYGIMSIPYVGVFKNGEMVAKSIGFMPEGEVRQFLNENL